MEEWLKNTNNATGKISHSSCYIILGGSGTAVTSIINELGFDPYYFNSATIKNSKEMIDLLTKAATLTSFIPKPKIAIFDDLEMLVQHDRVYLNALLEILEKKKLPNIPIIMLFPESMKKKTRHFVTGGATLFKADASTDAAGAADTREANFKEDPWLAPLCFHENLEKELATRSGTIADKRRAYIKYLDALCNWNYMMSKDYTEIAIDLINFETQFLLNKFKKKTGKNIHINTEFTKMLSQLSLYKKKERAKYTTNDSLFCI